jgi:hypothetical protein
MLTQSAGWCTVTQYKLCKIGGIARLLKLDNSEQFLPSNFMQYESNSQTSSLLSWGTKRTGWVCMSPTPNVRGPFVSEKQAYLTSSKLHQSFACFTLQIILIHLCHTENVKLSQNKPQRLRWGIGLFSVAFGTTRMSELSALRASHTLPPRKFLGTHFCYSLSGPGVAICREKE